MRRDGRGARCRAAALAFGLMLAASAGADPLVLSDGSCRLSWEQGGEGWRLREAVVRGPEGDLAPGTASGEYTYLYSAQEPPSAPLAVDGMPPVKRRDFLSPVELNVAGEPRTFFPERAERRADGSLAFSHDDDTASVTAVWAPDPAYPGDVVVRLTLTAKKAGWFSLATPSLTEVGRGDLAWAVVPGWFQGAEVRTDFPLAYAYGQGLPDRPVLARERSASTLASVVTARSGATLSVIADPGTGADPWAADHDTRQTWRLGLSHMSRKGALAPTLYHPVLGQDGSRLEAGQSAAFGFRYALRAGDWFESERHAIEDIYRFGDGLALKRSGRSLTDRLFAMRRYVEDDRTSMWRTDEFQGRRIGAQRYVSYVAGAADDAVKNADCGAVWMLERLTGDAVLGRDRLPYVRNFKLAQQQAEPGFFQGAALGQYYLLKGRRFVEEAGAYVEPVGLTYYTLIDLGNILLFTPDDAELRDRLRLGADRLLSWQKADGSWEVAYDRQTEQPRFANLSDLRPTFYGLLVAYRILGDPKYLAAAEKGADWLVRNAVEPGRFLGVCGDTYFAPDFATAQIAQALLDLADADGNARYREAGIRAARFYTTSVFTHPIPTTAPKTAGGGPWEDWQIAQAGLGYEHGGAIGSANFYGPIALAGHAGLFLRVASLTGDPLFRDMARAAALGRDAFVDPATGVASYYWKFMNKGAGPFPHHAWWQIGWITDYLVSEAAYRLPGRVSFPRGFMTPKVGPQSCYGFAPGKVLGEPASLVLAEGLASAGSPDVDVLTARAVAGRRVFAIVLNERAAPATAALALDPARVSGASRWTAVQWTGADGEARSLDPDGSGWAIPLPPFGAAVVAADFE